MACSWPNSRSDVATRRQKAIGPFCDADKQEYAGYFEQAMRLLRPGGVVAFDNALWHDRVADPTQRDEDTTSVRELGRAVREDERLTSALLAVGDGLLVGVKTA